MGTPHARLLYVPIMGNTVHSSIYNFAYYIMDKYSGSYKKVKVHGTGCFVVLTQSSKCILRGLLRQIATHYLEYGFKCGFSRRLSNLF